MSHARIDLGELDLLQLRVDQQKELTTIMQGFNSVKHGMTLEAGAHCIWHETKKIDYTFALNTALTFVGYVNLTASTPKNRKYLQLFLQPCYEGKMFVPGGCILTDYLDNTPGGNSYGLLIDKFISVSKNCYGEMLAHVYAAGDVAEGASAHIKNMLGTIRFRTKELPQLVYEPHRRKRILRVAAIRNSETARVRVVDEHQKSQTCLQLGVRGPAFFSAPNNFANRHDQNIGVFSGVSMRCLGSKDLYDYIADDIALTDHQGDRVVLRIDDRFQLSIELLAKLFSQVHALGYKHRDIKPENIRASKLRSGWDVNIIDYADALPEDEDDGRDCGTLHYKSFEMYYGHSTKKSDIFSMGLVIALLWGDQNQLNILDVDEGYETAKDIIFEMRDVNDWEISLKCFSGINGLTDKFKQIITEILASMLIVDEDRRPDVGMCLERFESCYLAYRLSLVPVDSVEAVSAAYGLAKQCREDLALLAKDNITSCDRLNIVSEKIRSAIDQLSDDRSCIDEFILTSKINCFVGAKQKQDLLYVEHWVFNKFRIAIEYIQGVRTKMLAICKQSEEPRVLNFDQQERLRDLYKRIEGIDIYLQKIYKSALDINVIQSLIDKILHKAKKLNAEFRYYECLKQSSETNVIGLKK